jgi:hypothetical protein
VEHSCWGQFPGPDYYIQKKKGPNQINFLDVCRARTKILIFDFDPDTTQGQFYVISSASG